MENLKTLGEMLQDIVEKENKRYTLYDFLEEENRIRREDIRKKLGEADKKQFEEYMDGYSFVNSDEVYMAVCEYWEYVNQRPLSMGECGDMSEVADDYIRNKNLNFDEE